MLKKLLFGALALFVLEAGGLLVMRDSGWVDVSAISPPSGLESWFLGGAADRSVEAHARPIAAVPHDDPKLLDVGLRHYNGMCVTCHGAPGLDDSEVAKGLNPPAPHLWTDDSQSLSDAQIYWIVKNGIRMTGMPAFGPTHEETELRAIVAFVRRLPSLKGGGYAALVRATGLKLPDGDDDDMGGMKMPTPPASTKAPPKGVTALPASSK